MLTRFRDWVSRFLVRDEEPVEIPEYNRPEVWPFEGANPPNEAVHKLNQGLEVVGEHIMYRNPDTGRFAGLLTYAEEGWSARYVTYWLAGGEILTGQTVGSVRASCGSQRCVRPDHLEVKYAPSRTQKNQNLSVSKVFEPPKYPQMPAKAKVKNNFDILTGDRTRCISSKVYFASLKEVQSVARTFNTTLRNPGERKLYGYDCPLCDGAHLTKQNPTKRAKHKVHGSWS